jgi:SAM-dependent methyltransferase
MNRYGEVFAGFYDRYFGDYAENTAPRLLYFLSTYTSARQHSKVLDLGCGTGRLAQRMLEAGYSLTGIDLSPDMIELSRKRCRAIPVMEEAHFYQADISHFHLDDRFDFAVSTYNVMNHLMDDAKLSGCMGSVRECLAERGLFLFDYNTRKGLAEWVSTEHFRLKEGEVDVEGGFDPRTGKAVTKLSGVFEERTFQETIQNFAVPLSRLADLLRDKGFQKIRFSRIDDLRKDLSDPESEKRIVVLAS